jgi:Fe-S cluster assembly protein SufD
MNVHARPAKTAAELALAGVYRDAWSTLPGGTAVAAQRSAAFEAFSGTGLPGSRLESWKYTDLRGLMTDALPLAAPPDAATRAAQARTAGAVLAGLGLRRLVITDGALDLAHSDLADLEPGLAVRAMAEVLASDEPLLTLGGSASVINPTLALNAALAGDGAVVSVAPGAVIARPIHLAFVNTGARVAAYTRSRVVVGADARVALVESHEGPDDAQYQVNTALEFAVGDGAQVDHVKVTREGDAALHVGALLADVGARTSFTTLGFTVGGALIRNDLAIRLAGEATMAAIRGVSLLAGTQHADTSLTVDHAAPGGQSRELFKTVVDDRARAVFQGRITVRQPAQQTDAKMMVRALLLSDDARADSKPELEIFADDVQCGHGATAGPMDEQLKFYLLARGIPEQEAKALLIQAFAAEAVETIAHEGLREVLSEATARWVQER